MASKSVEKKGVSDVSHSSSTQADVVTIRLEVDDLCPLAPSVQELAFNSSPETLLSAQQEQPAHEANATGTNTII